MSIHTVIAEDFSGLGISGLSPTFTIFRLARTGDALTAPTISDDGGGFYSFEYEAFEPVQFEVDFGDSVTDTRLRYARGAVPAEQAEVASALEEVLALLRNDLEFVVEGNETFQVMYRDNPDGTRTPWRKWKVTDHLGRAVDWPDSSRLPVDRERVL